MRYLSLVSIVTMGLLIAQALCAQEQSLEEKERIARQLSENALFSPGRNFDPNIAPDSWRFIPHIGWRKFAPNDVFYKDWRDYTRWMRFRPFPWWPY